MSQIGRPMATPIHMAVTGCGLRKRHLWLELFDHINGARVRRVLVVLMPLPQKPRSRVFGATEGLPIAMVVRAHLDCVEPLLAVPKGAENLSAPVGVIDHSLFLNDSDAVAIAQNPRRSVRLPHRLREIV